MNIVIAVILVVAGLINFFPLVGVMSAQRLNDLYGLSLDNPDLILLLRHRAVLFGLLGGFIIVSAFRRSLQRWACFAGLISMLAFIVLAYAGGEFGAPLRKIVVADVVASVGLVVVLLLQSRASGRDSFGLD